VGLGEEPYFSFIPLRPGHKGCLNRYRVSAEDAGWRREVHSALVPRSRVAAPAAVAVDLGEWAGREIELTLSVNREGPACANDTSRPLWGSPAVYGRSAEVRTSAIDRPDIILVSFDAMRADAVGPDAHGRSLTPAIDHIASEADVWTSAFSCFNVTNPSFASIMTGVYGTRHGVMDLQTPLSGAFETLAERLRDAGYATAGIVSAQHLSDAASGLGQGFDDYVVAPTRFSAETAADRAIDWLSAHDGPRFLWLHLFDPHTPHDAPEPYASGFRHAAPYGLAPVEEWTPFRSPGEVPYRSVELRAHEDLYDAEVAYADRQVDRLMGFLDSRDVLGRTVIVLVSDHGENGPRDRVPFRHVGLWEATTRVPLIIRRPQGAHRLHRELVQTIDLYPTLLELAGVPAPKTDGRSLFATGAGRSEVFAQHSHGSGAMVRDGRFSYSTIDGSPFLADGEFLFDIVADPEERTNLAAERPAITAEYRARLQAWLQSR
jgi:arylsulfatase A-like enzyme